jgi:hypothetical protein
MRLLRWLWRQVVILGLGFFSVWLIVFVIFRVTDNRLPWILALAVTYGTAAYIVLPRVIRLGLKVTQRTRVPEYTTAGDGLPGDPVNIALIGTLAELRAAFAAIGWTEADQLGLASSWRMVRAFLLNRPYPDAPFSTLYLFGRGQDIGFQKPIDDSPRKRHHVRLWSMDLSRVEDTLGTPDFWLKSSRPPDNEPVLWIGAATRDTGFSLTWLSFQITHATAADTNAERDLIVSEMAARRLIGPVKAYDERSELPHKRVNHYHFDGDVSVARLTVPDGAAAGG